MERYSLTNAQRFNIAHEQRAPIRIRDVARKPLDDDAHMRDGGGDVEREARWGLLAPWRGHGGKRGPMVFAADEATIAATPMLRNARAKRRCLVLADGWFAWRTIDKKSGKKRQPYWIHAPQPVAFAGVVAMHADDGVESFAIVTVPAVGIVAPIASVMPAIVDEAWLASPELVVRGLDGWRADAVSTRVDDSAHDDAACVATLGNPAQGELF